MDVGTSTSCPAPRTIFQPSPRTVSAGYSFQRSFSRSLNYVDAQIHSNARSRRQSQAQFIKPDHDLFQSADYADSSFPFDSSATSQRPSIKSPGPSPNKPKASRQRSLGAERAPLLSSDHHLEYGSHDNIQDTVDNQQRSSFTQTLFNTINILVGIGILAEARALAHAGLAFGIFVLIFCGAITCYSAKILARIMRDFPHLNSYADIGALAFGERARIWISLLFCLELFAASVALVVLFGDSLASLFPALSASTFKLVGFLLIAPTVFLPLRLLSFTSLIGIISTVGLVVVVVYDGSVKETAPGSLQDPIMPSLGPNWSKLPLSFGLIMSGYAGHACIPSIAKDMRHPEHFDRMINWAYIFAFAMYSTMAICGYLMFGKNVRDEITQSLLHIPEYPRIVNLVASLLQIEILFQAYQTAVWLIAANPICKFALCTRPLHSTIEYVLGLEEAPLTEDSITTDEGKVAEEASLIDLHQTSPRTQASMQILVRIATTAAIVFIAIVFPNFENVMRVPDHSMKSRADIYRSFLGAFSAFIICVFGPLSANLAIYGRQIFQGPRFAFELALFVVSAVMCLTGTIVSFLPQP